MAIRRTGQLGFARAVRRKPGLTDRLDRPPFPSVGGPGAPPRYRLRTCWPRNCFLRAEEVSAAQTLPQKTSQASAP